MLTALLLLLPFLAGTSDDLTRRIAALDAEVFDAYNKCDLPASPGLHISGKTRRALGRSPA